MGIIHSLKSHYKNELSTKKIFAIENKTQFKFNLLECLHLLKESWQKVTEKTVVNLDAEKVIIESLEASKRQTKITSYFQKL